MTQILKILGIVVAIVVFLVVALAIALPFFIDPNEYKPEIAKVVKTQTGRDLQLEGDIGLSVFPWIGLELGKTRLSNAAGFGKQPFLQVDKVEIKVELLPLLRKQVLVDKVVLDGLQLNLARDRRGRTNWDDLMKAGEAADTAPPEAPDTRERAAFGFGVAGMDIRRGEIHWRDATDGSEYHVRQLTVRTSEVAMSKPVDLHLSFDMESGKPVVKTRVALNGDVLFDPDSQRLQSTKMTLEAAGLALTASVDGKQLLDNPRFSGELSLANFNVKKFLADLNIPPVKTADATVLTKASMKTRFSASTSHVELNGLQLNLDDSSISGNASARFASLPAIRFDLSLNDIDVDRYLPPTAKEEVRGGKTAKAEPLPIPVKLLRQLDAKGKFTVQKMKAFGIRSTDIVIPISAKTGIINVGPNTAKLYQGRYAGNMRMDVRKSSPRYSVNEKLTDVQLGPFLKDTDIFDKFDGQGNVSARVTARGLDMDDIINTVNGKASVSLKNGSLLGINIYETINSKCRALQQPGAAPIKQESKNISTPFADLNASAVITNGVITNKDLSVKGKLLRVSGKGKVNLPKKHVDYLTNINLLGETTCWTTQFAVVVKGRFNELSAGKIIGDTLTYEYKKQIERKAKKALEEELKKRLGIPQKKAAPTAPQKKAPPPKKSPEEQLKEELRKRLGI